MNIQRHAARHNFMLNFVDSIVLGSFYRDLARLRRDRSQFPRPPQSNVLPLPFRPRVTEAATDMSPDFALAA